MVRLNIAIVHGIGINTQGYAAPLIKGVGAQFNKALQGILKTSNDYTEQLNFIPIIWDDIVAYQEAVLADIFREEFERRKKKGIVGVIIGILSCLVPAIIVSFLLRQPLLFWAALIFLGSCFVNRLMFWLRTDFAAQFVADVTSYNERGNKSLILQRIEDCITPLAGLSGVQNLSFVSHSLGTVIASDFVWERQKPGRLLTQNIFLSNFFTMGSPLPLFSLQFGGPGVFTKPITIQDPSGRWVNIYDKDDPVAYPLKPLNEAYNRVVLKDREVKVGIFGIAHIKYWSNRHVQMIIARKLALDWLRCNNMLDKARLGALSAEYDKNAGL